MSTIRANQWLNLDGTENYKCRAWVNFNGQGTPAIRASGNVASITDNGPGDFTVNFTTAMPDANYAVAANAQAVAAQNVSGGAPHVCLNNTVSPTTTAARLRVASNGGDGAFDVLVDSPIIMAAFFR